MSIRATKKSRNEGNQNWADAYRDRWTWDKIGWASHCIDCYPGNCPMRVYVKDGKAVREEQCGVMPAIEQGVPDMNPMGCQKGMAWSTFHYSQERLLYPMKRDGERGSGKWKRISWDEALTEVADAVIDAIEEKGAESIIHLSGCNTPTGGIVGRGRFAGLLGALTMDLNAEMNDFAPGHSDYFVPVAPDTDAALGMAQPELRSRAVAASILDMARLGVSL